MGLLRMLALMGIGDDVSMLGELEVKLVLIVNGLEGFVELAVAAATFVFELELTVGLLMALYRAVLAVYGLGRSQLSELSLFEQISGPRGINVTG